MNILNPHFSYHERSTGMYSSHIEAMEMKASELVVSLWANINTHGSLSQAIVRTSINELSLSTLPIGLLVHVVNNTELEAFSDIQSEGIENRRIEGVAGLTRPVNVQM